MIRLFIDQVFKKEGKLILSAPQSHYLTHVMRLKEGDKVICFNGKQGDWENILVKQKKEWFLLPQKQILSQQKREACVLCLALIKRDPLAFALQKVTELGVTEIHLIQAERSNNERVNMERLRTIVVEACEQCERNDIPEIFLPEPLPQKIKTLTGKVDLIWLSERGKTTAKRKFSLPPAYFIGPEGGWTDKEKSLFQQSEAFSWHLGNTILRAETAAIATLSLWQYRDEIKKLAI